MEMVSSIYLSVDGVHDTPDPPQLVVEVTNFMHSNLVATKLIAEFKECFTPVQLQALQSSLFHDRKQKPQEVYLQSMGPSV